MSKKTINPVLLVVLVVIGGLAGVAVGYFTGEVGMRDEYMRNYGMAGGGVGLILGLILGRRSKG